MLEGDAPRFWNLGWPTVGLPNGAVFWNDEPNLLDQVLVNRNMAGRLTT